MNDLPLTRPLEILLVEDNPDHVFLSQIACKSINIQNNLTVVTDGEEAIKYLLRRDKYENAVRPDLILLDLHLPKKDGHEIFEEIKAQETLKNIPLIILSSSYIDQTLVENFNLPPHHYQIKPLTAEKLSSSIKLTLGNLS